jgi:hypothetical protein
MFVALQRIKVGDAWLEPGDEVPVEEGRDYGLMQRLGHVAEVGSAPKAAKASRPAAKASKPAKARSRSRSRRSKAKPAGAEAKRSAPSTVAVTGAGKSEAGKSESDES